MSFHITRPSREQIDAFLQSERGSTLTYDPIGLSELNPTGFHVDSYELILGRGQEVFAQAKEAIDSWRGFEFDWLTILCDPRPDVGGDVGILVRHLGIWSLNACRVVRRYPVDDVDTRYGFAYGTLSGHAEMGEELFVVEMDPESSEVTYRIRAVSKPRALLAKLGGPASRRIQARFRQDSGEAMRDAIHVPAG